MDSGAGGNVWPKSLNVPGPMLAKTGVRSEAANGTPIANYGQKVVKFKVNGRRCSMQYNVADVKKPLAAVSSIVDEGNRVVFEPGLKTSYIENLKSGERLPLLRENGTFVLEMEFEKVEQDEASNTAADGSKKPFTGRA